MRPAQKLGDLIAVHMSKPGDVAEQKPEADFILSGLRTAIFARSDARVKILTDVADVLGCDAKDLEFLFAGLQDLSSPNTRPDIVVPDFRESLLAAAE